MILGIEAACGSILGAGRARNEDNFLFDGRHLPSENLGLRQILHLQADTSKPQVFAVFDGMGGEKDGHEAACLASQVFSREQKSLKELAMPGRAFFTHACAAANEAVCGLKRRKQLSRMGTTAAAVSLINGEIVSCNVGDSRIFRVRGGVMYQISRDHTDERIIAAMGLNKKPQLLQYIGMPASEMAIDPYITKGELEQEDAYLICSDGVTDYMEPQSLYAVIAGQPDTARAVEQILNCVEQAGGADNATVILLRITGERSR